MLGRQDLLACWDLFVVPLAGQVGTLTFGAVVRQVIFIRVLLTLYFDPGIIQSFNPRLNPP